MKTQIILAALLLATPALAFNLGPGESATITMSCDTETGNCKQTAVKIDKPNDGSFATECRLLLKDAAFKREDCDTVFKSGDPMVAAAKIKCGDENNIEYSYWTNTDDEGLVVACAPPRKRKLKR